MSKHIFIQNKFIRLAAPDSPILHVLIPGKQLCDQAKSYIDTWLNSGTILEPRLGSIIPHLLLQQYSYSHNLMITYIEPSVSLADVNSQCADSDFYAFGFSYEYFRNIQSVLLICSHFTPVQKIIVHLKKKRKESAISKNLKIVEFQHGWVVGKKSSLRHSDTFSMSNPDMYFLFDTNSLNYLKSVDQDVALIKLGDLLFSAQLLHQLNQPINNQYPTCNSNTCNLLVCFSERDLELGYVNANYLEVNNMAFPKELLSLIEYLKKSYDHISIKMRGKPHQNQDKCKKNFQSLDSQDSLASDLLWADIVCSAMSTVCLSSSYLGIPSFFYISKPSKIHLKLIEAYTNSIRHIYQKTGKYFYDDYLSGNTNWSTLTKSERRKISFGYARQIQSRFYTYMDKIIGESKTS